MTLGHALLLALSWHAIGAQQDFVWESSPAVIHACQNGDAKFLWHYNSTVFNKTSSVEWFFEKTQFKVLQVDRAGDAWITGNPYFPKIYGGRAFYLGQDIANAGLLLKDVTPYDEGTYRVVIAGYANVIGQSNLVLHTHSSLKPDLQVDNIAVEFDSKINKTTADSVTFIISTAHNLPANITISYLDKNISCLNAKVCSSVVPLSSITIESFSVWFLMDYDICEIQNQTVLVLTDVSYINTPENTTRKEEITDDLPFYWWYLVIIAVLVLIIILLLIIVLWIVLKRRENQGIPLKPYQKRYVSSRVLRTVMTPVAHSKVVRSKKQDDIVMSAHSSGVGRSKESIPLVEIKTQEDRLGPGNGNTLFINLARTKGLNDEVINSLLEEDFDTEEALGTMEDSYLQELTISDEQRDFLGRWIQELRTNNGSGSMTKDSKTSSNSVNGTPNSDFTIEDCLRNLQLGEKNEREIREYVLKHGVLGLEDLLRDKLDFYMQCPVNIAVTGRSGTGKSSLINTLRGLRAKDKGAAKVGVVETTFEMKPYKHPEIDNVMFWDLPGVNTPNFPRDTYLTDVEFRRYDAFIIACTSRLTQDDMWLAGEASKADKPFYFLRTKIDVDVASNKRDGDGNESRLLKSIREDIEKNLAQENLPGDRVFLISTILKNKRKWDFPKLVGDLVSRTPERNKFAMIMAMVNCSKEIIDLKKEDLHSRVAAVALQAALSDGGHEQIIQSEIELYFECFGVNDHSMHDIDTSKLDARLKDIKTMIDSIRNQPVEECRTGRQVGKWIFGIGYLVGMIIDDQITRSRKAEAARHQQELVELTGEVARDAIAEEAMMILEVVLTRCEELAKAVLEQRHYMDD